MVTVSLLGTAAFLCVLLGIPLGIWFGKNQKAYNAALPVLDFMQTMPAFVYLIRLLPSSAPASRRACLRRSCSACRRLFG